LTGVSATGMPVCVIVHNFVYGLFIALFGEEFWGPGGDEPLFCPRCYRLPSLVSDRSGSQRHPYSQGENEEERRQMIS